ncbi:MAG: TrmB family transcriptional regulator [Euryarchaeota archaeon]|nr:TrmB family transcriptional regulator [Euryarchaeota archaeon]
MTINADRLNRMQEFGLTEYEARAYLALLDLDIAHAGKVADLSRVPRTKIYQALDGLEAKHLIKVIPERPKKYAVCPFSDYLDGLESSFRTKAEEIETNKAAIALEFAPRNADREEEDGSFVVVKGRGNVASKLMTMCAAAQESFTVFASANAARRMAYFAPILKERSEAGVRVTIVTDEIHEDVEREFAGFAEVRRGSSAGSALIVIRDSRELLTAHSTPDDTHYFQGGDTGVVTDDAAIVAAVLNLIEANGTRTVPTAIGELQAQSA